MQGTNYQLGQGGQTVGQWLEELARSNTSNEHDEREMTNILHRFGFPAAVVTCGIVYLEGKGTMDAPPAPIQSIAGMLVKAATRS